MDKTLKYLGDGLYAKFDGFQIALMVNDHRNEPVAYLDSQVMENLVEYIKDLKQ